MRILNNDDDKKLDDILLILTKWEAKLMVDSLSNMLESDIQGHCHIEDQHLKHEVTIGIYNEDGANSYAPRILKLIRDDI